MHLVFSSMLNLNILHIPNTDDNSGHLFAGSNCSVYSVLPLVNFNFFYLVLLNS